MAVAPNSLNPTSQHLVHPSPTSFYINIVTPIFLHCRNRLVPVIQLRIVKPVPSCVIPPSPTLRSFRVNYLQRTRVLMYMTIRGDDKQQWKRGNRSSIRINNRPDPHQDVVLLPNGKSRPDQLPSHECIRSGRTSGERQAICSRANNIRSRHKGWVRGSHDERRNTRRGASENPPVAADFLLPVLLSCRKILRVFTQTLIATYHRVYSPKNTPTPRDWRRRQRLDSGHRSHM